MGQTVSDTWLTFHGEGSTGHAVAVRLHWGDQGIDETLAVAIPTVRGWCAMANNADWSGMRTSFELWLAASSASAGAKARSTAFAGSLRSGLGG